MFKGPQEQHEMILETIHPTGAEEWFCPTCGRRFLMQWPPSYNKVILDPGDESAIHSGGRNGLSMSASLSEPSQSAGEVNPLTEQEQQSLQPWIEWMERVDFERLWQ